MQNVYWSPHALVGAVYEYTHTHTHIEMMYLRREGGEGGRREGGRREGGSEGAREGSTRPCGYSIWLHGHTYTLITNLVMMYLRF